MRRLPLGFLALAAPLLVAPLLVAPSTASAATAAPAFMRWNSNGELVKGAGYRVKVANGGVALTTGTQGTWTSPWVSTGYAAKTLVPSWSASTPSGTRIKVEARVKSGSTTGSWDTVADWAFATDQVKRKSGSSQTDDLAKLATDTVAANSGRSFTSWQLRVTLVRKSSKGASPVLQALNGVAAPYATRSRATSKTTMTSTIDLKVPVASQMIHKSHYREFDGGGAAWCSPTSASMLMGHAGLLPRNAFWAYTKESQGYVDFAARQSYDYRYKGTGNWAFTTAYASSFGADAFVTRLDSFAEGEQLIKAGIPFAISVAFGKGQLSNAPLSSTPGHLMVVRGFRSDGAVIVNDPAAPSNSSVGRIYSRAQLEQAWQKGSGGIVYVVRKPTQPLPANSARWRP